MSLKCVELSEFVGDKCFCFYNDSAKNIVFFSGKGVFFSTKEFQKKFSCCGHGNIDEYLKLIPKGF